MPRELPFATVVVPTRDRPAALRRCLRALAALSYPRDRLEVVVVEDGGASVRRIVEGAAELARLRLVVQRAAGPAVARNRGAAVADGDLLAFTDDDCRPEPGWLAALARATTTAEAVGGRTVNALEHNRYAAASQALIGYLYDYYGAASGRPRFLASNNLAVDTGAFRAVGGFDEKLPRAAAEDREFCHRWLVSGGRLAYARDAVVRHAHDLSLAGFCRQHFRYGRGALYFHRARAALGGVPLSVEPPAFYLGLLRRPLTEGRGPAGWATSALLALAQLANAAGFACELALDATGRPAPAPHGGAARARPA